MLLRYFLKRFFLQFILFLGGLVPLFSSCNVIVRLASVPFSFQIMKLLWLMLPLICVFAVPIASALAVGITVGNLFSRDELLLLQYFPEARRKLGLATWIFSFVLFAAYVPMVFQLAPASYWKGKRFLFRAAQTQIENLPENKFHKIGSRCTIFFQEKVKEGSSFKNLLLMVRQKKENSFDGKEFLVTAQGGTIDDGVLNLFDGVIYNNGDKNQYVTSFKKLELAFEEMFFPSGEKLKKQTKFLEVDELVDKSKKNLRAFQEFHKRVGQVLWQLLLPFLMLWLMMFFGKKRSNLLLSVIVGGGLFLFSYISLNMAYFFLSKNLFSLSIFYGIPIGVALVAVLLGRTNISGY